MNSSLKQFQAIIESKSEETNRFDFKEKLGSLDDLAEDVMAFANASGGVIYFGVNKEGHVVGTNIAEPNRTIDAVVDKLEPPIRLRIEPLNVADSVRGVPVTVYALSIPKSKHLHCTKGGRYKIRVQNGNRPILHDEVVRLANERKLYQWDSGPAVGVVFADLDLKNLVALKRNAEVSRSAVNLARMDDQEVLSRLGLVDDEGPTKAGILFLAADPQETLPHAVVHYLRYDVGDPVKPVQREIIGGTLGSQIERLESLISSRNQLHQVPAGAKYIDVYDYPIRVIHEAVTNAVAHRDYAIADQIVVRHRPDRISIKSPGTWPPGVTQENFLRHNVARNPRIAEALRLSGYVERAGIGMPLMFQEMARYGKQPPEIIADERHVEVILHAPVSVQTMINLLAELDARGSQLELNQILILWHLHVHRTVDYKEAMHLIQRGEAAARQCLKQLATKKLIERSGYKYRLADEAFRLERREAAYTRQRGVSATRRRNMVSEHLDRFGKITNGDVRQLFDVDMYGATEILKELAAKGIIEATPGSGKRYREYRKAYPGKGVRKSQ